MYRTRHSNLLEHARLAGGRCDGFAALGAKAAYQALREHTEQTRGEQVRFHTHVGEPGHRACGIVGVQRGEDQVPGEARLDGDLRSLEIADLADHDDVGILAEDRTERARKVELDLRIDLGLTDTVQRELDRILDRHDVEPPAVEP